MAQTQNHTNQSPAKPWKYTDPPGDLSDESVEKQHCAHSASTISSATDLSSKAVLMQVARASFGPMSRARVWLNWRRGRAGPSLIATSPVASCSRRTPSSTVRAQSVCRTKTAARRHPPPPYPTSTAGSSWPIAPGANKNSSARSKMPTSSGTPRRASPRSTTQR